MIRSEIKNTSCFFVGKVTLAVNVRETHIEVDEENFTDILSDYNDSQVLKKE